MEGLGEDSEPASLRLKRKQAEIGTFIDSTGRTRRRNREWATGFDRGVSARANAAAKIELDKRAKYDIINITESQFGKKIGKHAADYGLDPSKAADRDKMLDIILDISRNYDEVFIGKWYSIKGATYYVKGQDVVIKKPDDEFLTILKGGVNNARVKEARRNKN